MLYRQQWWENIGVNAIVSSVCDTLRKLQFTSYVGPECVFSFGTEIHHCMPETMEHRLLRSRKISMMDAVSEARHLRLNNILWIVTWITNNVLLQELKEILKKSEEGEPLQPDEVPNTACKVVMLPEFPHIYREPVVFEGHPTFLPSYMYQVCPKVILVDKRQFCRIRVVLK